MSLRRRYAPLWVSLWLVSLPALADNTADEADVAFALGNKAYAHRQYEEALREYFQSYRLVANRNVLFNIARCYEALDRFNEAYRYYSDLLALELPPEDRREVTEALSPIRPHVALVRIQTEPSGADVFIDREDLGSRGRSPLVLALPPGKHLVKVGKEGFHPAQASLQLTRGREVSRSFPLERILGFVQVDGTPKGAWVREEADGPSLATLPGKVGLSPGHHVLHVGAPGYTTSQLLVDVRADETSPVQVELPILPVPSGKVILTANRDSALIRVDGKEAGFAPTILTLSEGGHLLEVSTPEMRTWERKVMVPRDGEVRVHAELYYAPPPVQAASKGLRSVDEAPASVTIITREEIRGFGYTTLAEALQAVRGFFITDDRQYTYLGIRGFSPPGDLNTRILILWDGHAMNDVWAGQGYAGRELDVDLEEVDHIEVVRGPGSALYGTGALFGIINVVPRDRVGEGHSVEATGAVGGLDSWRGHLTGSLGPADRSGLVSFSGYTATGAEVTDLGSAGGLVYGLDGERAYDASARGHLGGFTFSSHVNYRVKDIPTGPFGTLVGAPGTQVVDGRGFAELRYDQALPFGQVSARGYYDASRYHGSWVYPEGTGTRTDMDAGGADWIGAEGRLRLGLFEDNQLTLGLEDQLQLRVYQAVFGASTNPPLETRTRNILSAYLMDEWKLGPRLLLSLGLRVDKYSDLTALPVSPRLALIARPYPGGLTKLVAGSAFRAPDVYELYYQDYGVTQLPALRLNPEVINTLELEHSHDLTRELRFTVAGYWNRISQLVELLPENTSTPRCGTPPDLQQCLVFQNTPEPVQAFGAEAELRWQPGRFALVDVSYSYVYLLDPPATLHALLPAHVVAGRVMLPIGETGVRFSAQAIYQSARGQVDEGASLGEALLINLGLSGDLGHLRYFAGVKNLLDVRYSLPTGSSPLDGPTSVPQYGRTFLLQLTGSF